MWKSTHIVDSHTYVTLQGTMTAKNQKVLYVSVQNDCPSCLHYLYLHMFWLCLNPFWCTTFFLLDSCLCNFWKCPLNINNECLPLPWAIVLPLSVSCQRLAPHTIRVSTDTILFGPAFWRRSHMIGVGAVYVERGVVWWDLQKSSCIPCHHFETAVPNSAESEMVSTASYFQWPFCDLLAHLFHSSGQRLTAGKAFCIQ